MGAHSIDGILAGQNLRDAYDEAVKDALHYHGHDPYNGTISTTNGTKRFRGEVPECFKTAIVKPWGEHTEEEREAINKIEDAALNQSEKWEEVVVIEVAPDKDGTRRWWFCGWAAS